jgi:dTDP-4-dehydrorhamnose reductase
LCKTGINCYTKNYLTVTKTKMKVLILGAGGMAGHMLHTYFKQNTSFEIFTAARNKINADTIEFDAFDEASIKNAVEKCKSDVVINAVGLLVKEANTNPKNAVYVNAYLPFLLSQITAANNAYTIHLSTDCVFSGKKGGYVKDDAKDAKDFYGQSKALGELINENDLTIRTSIIGPEIKRNGTGLMDWYLKTNGQISGYSKVYWSGITTLELAKVIVKAINYKEKGLVQISNNDKISKFDLLQLIGKSFNKNIADILQEDKIGQDKSLICSVAPEKYNIPSYAVMIEALKDFMLANAADYKHNYTNL